MYPLSIPHGTLNHASRHEEPKENPTTIELQPLGVMPVQIQLGNPLSGLPSRKTPDPTKTLRIRPNKATWRGFLQAKLDYWFNHKGFYADTEGAQPDLEFLTSDINNFLADMEQISKEILSKFTKAELAATEMLEEYYLSGTQPRGATEAEQMLREIVRRARLETGLEPENEEERREMIQIWLPREGKGEKAHRYAFITVIPFFRNKFSVFLSTFTRETLAYFTTVPGPVGIASTAGYIAIQAYEILRMLGSLIEDERSNRATLASRLSKGGLMLLQGTPFVALCGLLQGKVGVLCSAAFKTLLYCKMRDALQAFFGMSSNLQSSLVNQLAAAGCYGGNQDLLDIFKKKFANNKGADAVLAWIAGGQVGPKPSFDALQTYYHALFNWVAESGDDLMQFLLSVLLEAHMSKEQMVHAHMLVVSLEPRCPNITDLFNLLFGVGNKSSVNCAREAFFNGLIGWGELLSRLKVDAHTMDVILKIMMLVAYPALPYSTEKRSPPNIEMEQHHIHDKEQYLRSTHVEEKRIAWYGERTVLATASVNKRAFVSNADDEIDTTNAQKKFRAASIVLPHTTMG
jgi:hypothetical protein